MSNVDRIIVHGAEQIRARLKAEQQLVQRNQGIAAMAAAKSYVPHIKAALPRKSGRLRRHVRAYRLGTSMAKAKVTGHVAHLVLADVKEHAIYPRGIEAAQVHHIQRHRRMSGPMLAKQAITTPDGPRAHAQHPATRGHPEIIPRVKAEFAGEALHAAKEALHRGY